MSSPETYNGDFQNIIEPQPGPLVNASGLYLRDLDVDT